MASGDSAPAELFVRTSSAPEDFARPHGPRHAARSARISTNSRKRLGTSSSSTCLPSASQVAVRSLHTSGGERSRSSWTDAKGNWIHRSSTAPYQEDVGYKQHRLPRVLLARLGSWRPSTAAGKGAAPTTMPELFPLKPHFRPGRGAKDELDQRIDALREIFAQASPQSSREWTMPPRLEELAKPRMVPISPGLAFRDCAPPPEALLKKKKRPLHIPMSPKEYDRLCASGVDPIPGQRGDSFGDELDDRPNRTAGKYGNTADFGAASPIRSEASAQSRRRQPASGVEKRSLQSTGAEVSKIGHSAKSAAKPNARGRADPPAEQLQVNEAREQENEAALVVEGDSEPGEPDTAADEELAESDAAAESEEPAESESVDADLEGAPETQHEKQRMQEETLEKEREVAATARHRAAEEEEGAVEAEELAKAEELERMAKESEAALQTSREAPVGIGIANSQHGRSTGGQHKSMDFDEDTDDYSGFERSGTGSPAKSSSNVLLGNGETLPGQVAEVPRKIPRNLKLPELPLEQQQQIAALRIQSQYRGRLGRRKFAKVKASKKEHENNDNYSDEGFDED